MSQSYVVAVTVTGPLRYSSVEEALESKLVRLENPIFSRDRPIDVTLIRGPGLEDYDGSDPWTFLSERAQTPPEPIVEAVKKTVRKAGRKAQEALNELTG